MGFGMSSFLVLSFAALMIYIGDIKCMNTTKRFFLTIDIPEKSITNIRESLKSIRNTLCKAKDSFDSDSVSCFQQFKVVGEPRVIVVVDVFDSTELERRLTLLLSHDTFKIESEPIVDYELFATQVLGVDEALAVVEGNTHKNIPEAIWCEFNLNFGDMGPSEILALWKQEAELVLRSRKSGNPLEIFKTVGERTVHLLTERDASVFDRLLFGVPFNQNIPNTMKTTCKTIVKLKNVISS